MNKTSPTGVAALENPIFNKGTAFTIDERKSLGLEGLLPAAIETLDTQVERALGYLSAKPDALCASSTP